MSENIHYIDDDTGLAAALATLHGQPWLAIDTEFERVNTYYPELCLIQIATAKQAMVIDPLAITDTTPLYDLLYDPAIIKVFHAARQDMELFWHLRAAVPMPLFDTQVAAAVLGYDSQIGYANLVQEVLGVALPKTQTRTDWKRRPLKPQQLQYAVDDVIHLAALYQRFHQRLTASGQLSIVMGQCEAMNDAALYEPDPMTVWKKIRIARRLTGKPVHYLQALAAWREQTARQENRPRKWVLGDYALLDLAKKTPVSMAELADLDGMNDQVIRRYGEELLAVIRRAADTPVSLD